MTYTELIHADQRLYILKALVEMGFEGNDRMLITALDAFGHRVSHAQMIEHLNFLKEKGLVTLTPIVNVTRVELTTTGQDAADGREIIEGIRKPKAGE